jgi:hypothetical protein
MLPTALTGVTGAARPCSAPDHQRAGIALGVAQDALLRRQDGVGHDALRRLDAHEHAGQQQALRVGDAGAQHDRAGVFVHAHFAEFDGAGFGIVAAIFQLDMHGGAGGQHAAIGQRLRSSSSWALDWVMST